MKIFLLPLFLLVSLCAYNQTVTIEASINPSQISDGLGKIVIFSKPDSSLVKGSYLDSSYFSTQISAQINDAFYMKVIVPGYMDTIINFVVEGDLVKLGTILQNKDLTLDAVKVSYRKELFERTMNGIQVNVDGTSLAELNTLFDVLKAAPRLNSPDDESIEIIGKGTPLILVDRQAIISNEELKAIPADQIEKIEIITSPSAKYKAQGSGSGVIEVYTKNFSLEGYQASIRVVGGMSTQNRPTTGGHLALSYKKKKFSLNSYFGLNYTTSNYFSNEGGSSSSGISRSFVSSGAGDQLNIWSYYSLKAAYAINDDQKLSLGFNGNFSKSNRTGNSFANYYMNDTLTTSKSKDSENGYSWLRNSAFLNYTWETDTLGSALEFNINYFGKKSNQNQIALSELIDATNGSSRFDVKSFSKDQPNVGEVRLNYEHYFDTTGWVLGVGGEYGILLNGKRFDQSNLVNNSWVIDDAYSNSYDYKEDNFGVYAEISKKWNKFGMRVGLRGEYTKLYGYSSSLDQTFMDSSYFAVFPNVNLLFEPNEKLGITVYYESGIERPQFSNYDPFVRIQDSLSIEYGNPFLRPSMVHSVGLEFDLFYAYNISFTYSRTNDPVSQLDFIRDDSFLSESTPRNAKSEDNIGMDLSIPFQLPWLQGWNSIWGGYSKYEFSEEFGRETFYNMSYGVSSYLTFKLPKRIDISNHFSLWRWGGDNSIANASFNWGIRVNKKFEKTKFQCYAEVSNIAPNRRRWDSTNGNYTTFSEGQYNFTSFKLGLSHRFGRLKAPDNIKDSSSGQSERL